MVTVVFGARGSVGRHVASGLHAAGEDVRPTSRNPGGSDLVAADLDRPETLPAALEGAGKVFLYAHPDHAEGFVAAAEAAGVRHVVLLSSSSVVGRDADTNPIALRHRAVETALEGSRLDWTFIRPAMFATNTLWWWREPVRAGGPIRLPYPEALTAPVYEKDLAAIAVTALTGSGHEGQAYTVHGARTLTLREKLGHIGDAIGRRIVVEEIPVEQARDELAAIMAPHAAEITLRIWTAGAKRRPPTNDAVERILGRPGQTFAEWARDHAGDFRPA